jgi:WD40 repeat protein
MRYILALSLLPLATVLAGAQEPDVPPIKVVKLELKEPVPFEQVDLILADKCLSCHAGALASKSGKLDMSTYDLLMKGGKSGKAVDPGRPNESLLVKLAGRTQQPIMPPVKNAKTDTPPLKPEELALIKLWIEQGAKAPKETRIASRPAPVLKKIPDMVTPVVAVAVSPDKAMVAAGRGSQIHVYDAGTGNYIRSLVNADLKDDKQQPLNVAHLDIVQALAFSPDGRLLASGGFQEVILWDVQTGVQRQKLTGFKDRVVSLDFSRDGKWLACGGGAPTEDGEIKVIDVAAGKILLDIANGHSDTVFGVRFSPDGKLLATCAADKFVKVFEMPGGKFVKSFEGHTHHVMDVGWKPDGKLLASGGADNVIKVWDYEKGEQTRTINAHGKQVTRLLFIGNTSQFVTCSGDASVKFWNVDNGGNVRNFGGSNDYLYAVGVSPDGAIVAAGGQESVVRLYNGTNGQLLKTLAPPGTQPEAPK